MDNPKVKNLDLACRNREKRREASYSNNVSLFQRSKYIKYINNIVIMGGVSVETYLKSRVSLDLIGSGMLIAVKW